MSSSGKARLPAEWEPQAGVMLTWPHPDTNWSDRLDRVYPVFTAIGAAIAEHEALLSVCQSPAHARQVRDMLVASGSPAQRLLFGIAPSDDTWARDHGALTTLQGDQPVLNDFVFNGWGEKFPAARDSAITGVLHSRGNFGRTRHQQRAFVIEGGAVETDGAGTLLATRSSVITATRNPTLEQAEIEAHLAEWLGFERFLWLEHGDISGDDTDGHVDTLARFADRNTILHATAPPGDADHAELAAMAAELRDLRTTDGQPYRLVALPFAGLHLDEDGRRLPATYANFLVINGAVLLPVYKVPQDDEAIAVIGEAFPQHRVVPIDCREIIWQYGSLHCLTMQFPAQVELHDTLEGITA